MSQIFVVKDRFNLDGVELKTSIKEPGYKLYDLKIYKEIYLEDHDNFRCKNYANFGDYNSVREELSINQILAVSVCTQIVSKYLVILAEIALHSSLQKKSPATLPCKHQLTHT